MREVRALFKTGVALVLATFATLSVTAQDFGGGMYFDMGMGGLMTNQLSISQPRGVDAPMTNADRGAPSTPVLTYQISSKRTRANLQAFVEKSRAADPVGAQKMETLFASTDIISEIGNAMASIGLSRNNAADAYALYWVSAWQAAHGDVTAASAQTYRSVAAQVARGMAGASDFAQANEAERQRMAEAMMVQAALIDASKDAAIGNTSQLKALADAVSKGAAASGLELDKMTLTEDGFVPAKGRKGADASGAVAGEQKNLASAGAAGEGDNDASPNYALIAGAAGAGLGVAFLLGKMVGKKG